MDFTASATDPDGQIETYRWNFGDGESANGPNPTHTFDDQGRFNVSLTVTDDRDGTASTTRTVDVQQRFTRATVTEVEIQDMPFTNDEGLSWDLTTGPDVYYVALNPDLEQLERSSTIDNIGPGDLPITPTGEFTIEDLSGGAYTISLWDGDASIDDEFIESVFFNLEDEIGTYPESRTVTSEEVTIRLSVDWKE